MLSAARRFVREGHLRVTLADGSRHEMGPGGPPEVHLRFTDPGLPVRVLRNPDVALGEAYMDGAMQVDAPDLRAYFSLLIRNSGRIDPMVLPGMIDRAVRQIRARTGVNPVTRARRNVAHHYDLTGEIYDLFLDAGKHYTCAYFRRPDLTLEQAQAEKVALIGRKLLIAPGMRVLDIGCGFGSLAMALARDFGAHVTGVTLSRVQLAEATARAAALGLADRTDFRLQDYRDVTGPFDRVVSVGMMEHVGLPHLPVYFGKLRDLLAADGVALIHYIGRPGLPEPISAWFDKYIFPGAYCPALSEVLPVTEKAGLVLTDLEVWRGHYERTLAAWLARFEANAERARDLYDERFVRMWRYYLTSAMQSFAEGTMVIHQVQLARRGSAVPMTRDYLWS